MTSFRVLMFALVIGCGGSGVVDPIPPTDADDGVEVTLPTWRLEDVQPQSPNAGQTHGLETFSDKIVVVTLLEGF